MERAIKSVLAERTRQDSKWGVQNHDMFKWLAILTEEVGEFSSEVMDIYFRGLQRKDELREEAVHVAAVALAMVECLDRGKWEFDKR